MTTLEEFRKQCAQYVEDELGIVDLLAKDDPYEAHLAIDFARREGYEDELRHSIEQEEQ